MRIISGLATSEPLQPTDACMEAIIAALRNSLMGLRFAVGSERAVRQELAALGLGIPLALVLSGQLWVRVALVGVLLLVLAVELLNTAVEKLCDHLAPEQHPAIGRVKDLGSAAVFCALVLAALVWAAALLDALDGAP
jgi:diacylglycerol kinase (ATP)